MKRKRFSVVVRGQSVKKNPSSLPEIETLNIEHTYNTGRTHIECVQNKDATTAKQRKKILNIINLSIEHDTPRESNERSTTAE